jgi:L-histidine N-alpha-methyltransferase
MMAGRALENQFALDVRAGLGRAGQKTLPSSYLYDELGSALFEAITCLPEYGLTRADARLIQAHAGEIVERLPRRLAIVELGSGSGTKTRAILERARTRHPAPYYPIDVSAAALARCALELSTLAEVIPIEAGFVDGLRRAAARREPGQKLLVLFLGSTIGNFDLEAAADFLHSVRLALEHGDALLLGTDLVKPAAQLLDAYDDPAGVTAAFNLNLLGRINRELGADFDLRRFRHMAVYDEPAHRIEMRLRSLGRQTVNIRGAGLIVEFARGETILTEISQKFESARIGEIAKASGFELCRQWIDAEWPFAGYARYGATAPCVAPGPSGADLRVAPAAAGRSKARCRRELCLLLYLPFSGPQFLHRAQKSDHVLAAQHADHLAPGHHRKLVDPVAVHLLESGPKLGVGAGVFQLLQGEHGLGCACGWPVGPGHFLHPVQGHQANGICSALNEKATSAAAEDVLIHELLQRQFCRDGGAVAVHGLRNRVIR